MTALDCLSYLEEIKICTGYEVDGKVIKDFPTTPTLKKCKPVFTTMKGWHCDIRGIKNYDASLRKQRITLNLSKRKSAILSQWYQTALKEKQLFTEINN